MTSKLETIEHTVSMSLDGETVSHDLIEERVRNAGAFMNYQLTENEKKFSL